MNPMISPGCICIALGVFRWGIGIEYGVVPLGLGIFMMGFWAFNMVVNPELKDYGEERPWRSNHECVVLF